MSLIKKIVAIATVFSVLTFVSPVFGATVEELQAQINLLQATLSQLQAQLAALQGQPTVTGCTITSFDRNLKQGMSGDDVKCLQIILNSATDTQVATTGAGSPGSETTYFGPLTFEAVKKFQEKHRSEILDPIAPGFAPTGYVGAKTRAKLNTLIGVTPPPTGCTTDAQCSAGYMCSAGTCVVKPAVVPMSVALATDTPMAANLWAGSANNIVTKLTFYGGSTSVSVTGLTLTSYGTTRTNVTTDISAVKIFDENNIQQGTDRTVAGNRVNFVFVPAITVPANGSRTLSVAVNIGSSAQVMSTVKLGLAGASDIIGGTFSGTFPVAGNTFTIVPAGSAGSISIGQYGSLPKNTAKIGETNVVFEKFTVSAGANEDVEITQITVKNYSTATISDSDITNIRIREVGGAVVAGPANLSAKKATINFIAPLSLTKGTAKNLEVIADVASGYNRTVMLYIDEGGVVGRGKLSGINLTSTGSTSGSVSADTVTIGKGAVSVSMSSAHPQGSAALLVASTSSKTIAAFSVRAIGEDVIFNTIDMRFNATNDLTTTRYLSGVGLYVDGALASDLLTVDDEGTQSFSLNLTIPANTTKDIVVKAITSTLGTGETSWTLITTWYGYSGYGLSSGESLTNADTLATSQITIYAAGTASLSADYTKTPYSQGVLAPSNAVVLGALKVRADREDQRLYRLVVTPSAGSQLSSLTLYAEDGTTQLSNPVTPSSSSPYAFSFTTDDFLTEIIFYKGVYKTILLKGNVRSDATETPFYLTITAGADQFETVGMDSGQTFDATLGSALNFYHDTSPYPYGKFVFDDNIVEMKKRSDSPSGSQARSNETVTARWDLTAVTTDLTSRTISAITFTSKTGLPASGVTTAMFKLYEEGGIAVATNATSVNTDAGTVTFSGFPLTVPYGTTKELYLTVNTLSSSVWPAGTGIHWTVAAYGNVTIDSDGTIGYGGTTWSLPADANKVTVSGT